MVLDQLFFPNKTKVQRNPSSDGDVLIAHLSIPSVSTHLAKEKMEIRFKRKQVCIFRL